MIAALQGLQAFKSWLRAHVMVEAFTTPDDLGRKIATTLAQVAQQAPAAAPGAAPPPRPPELPVVHALQPAPHFSGRAALVATLSTWVDDIASPDRLHALVAAGGTGKTAITEQVLRALALRWPVPGAGHVLAWSFYERPDADALLRECGQLFLGEPDNAPPGVRLERLQRGLRNGQLHLLVMDGLERLQAEAGAGRVRGELEDTSLRLLQAVAAGLGRTRALLTSRFPLTDLRDWQHRGVVETALDDPPPDSARQVLRGWGMQGLDAQLDAVATQVGRHALSVAVIGSYLQHFEGGRIEAAAGLDLDAAAGDDPKAAKLARVLGFYAHRLPADERELLARLAVYPRGITLDLLGVLLDAGGAVARLLVDARPALPKLLQRLVDRGLVFRYAGNDQTLTWTAHPFVRERLAGLLGRPASEVFEAVAQRLGQGLQQRPENKPKDVTLLDRYEQLIEATRLAGRGQEAFELYWFGLGSYRHLGGVLGDYARGYRILRGFVPESGNVASFGQGLTPRLQSVGLNDLAMMARRLGRLHEALSLRREDDERSRRLGNPAETSRGLLNTCELACDFGELPQAHATGAQALAEAVRASDNFLRKVLLAHRAHASHLAGDIRAAQADFAAATALEEKALLYSNIGQCQAEHHLDQGARSACRAFTQALAVRGRIGDTQAQATRDALARLDAPGSRPRPSRRQHLERRKVGPEGTGIPRQQGPAFDRSMGPDEEVRQHLRLVAPTAPVLGKGLGSQEQCRPRNLAQLQRQRSHHVVQRLKGRERQGHLGVDHRVDDQGMLGGLRPQLGDRPVGPLRIVLQHVHQDVGVHQQHQSSARSSIINASVRQGTSARPRTASKRSGAGRREPFAGLGRTRTTSPAAFTENSIAAPGSSCSSSRMRLGMVTCPLLVSVVDIGASPGITESSNGNTAASWSRAKGPPLEAVQCFPGPMYPNRYPATLRIWISSLPSVMR